jgi:transposase
MGRTRGQPNLTTEKKARVAGMVEAGMSHTNVAKVIGLARSTVSAMVTRSRNLGTVQTAAKPGRPRLTTDRNILHLQNFLGNHPRLVTQFQTQSQDQLFKDKLMSWDTTAGLL